MGIFLSRFRKKKSTVETLEKLDNDIKDIEESRTNAQRKYKKITKLLLVYSLALYVLCGIIFYFHYNSTPRGKLLYLVPLAISPLILYIVKRIISWYFVRLINKNQIKLNEMKKEKKRILDEVMEKETYKVAKQILEKFANENVPKPNAPKANMQLAPMKQYDDGLRRRIVNTSNLPKVQTPGMVYKDFNRMPAPRPIISTPATSRVLQAPNNSMVQLPAPIIPLDRGYMDRVVEYLIGDGPNNRYALICSRCHSHNGMALKEEFEYIGFKCCYCFNYNPARKIRPEAPKLESSFRLKQDYDSDSDSKTSGENSDAEAKAQIKSGEKSGSVNSHLEASVVNYDVNLNSAETMVTEDHDEYEEKSTEGENTSGAIIGAENNKKEMKLRKSVETQNNSNQSENDANCD